MHDAPVQIAQLQGVILTAMHDAPVQVAQLQGVILTVMHGAGSAAGSENSIGEFRHLQIGNLDKSRPGPI